MRALGQRRANQIGRFENLEGRELLAADLGFVTFAAPIESSDTVLVATPDFELALDQIAEEKGKVNKAKMADKAMNAITQYIMS